MDHPGSDLNQLAAALKPKVALPSDSAVLVGRAWHPQSSGPMVVTVRDDELIDITRRFPTITDLVNTPEPGPAVADSDGPKVGSVEAILANSSFEAHIGSTPWLLAPVDLQPIKASGVTFAASLLERVIEEQAGGDKARADEIRDEVLGIIGTDLSQIRPGSDQAMQLKDRLVAQGAWSPYLEVGIGPDAEVFTKASPMSSVGTGAKVGIRSDSDWNNPEPELAVLVSANGAIVGATLGNDVNLRDIEGRSALLLGKAKDNNASTALGPFIRLIDEVFTLERMNSLVITMLVTGEDGFVLEGSSSLQMISRTMTDLVGQIMGKDHQYPDGVVLMSGTMFAPTKDRGEPGQGFTHHVGDVVRITSPQLGSLVNQVDYCENVEPWEFGVHALMSSLAGRGLLSESKS